MDGSSEENLVRMGLGSEPGLGPLKFNLQKRQVTAVHQGDEERLLRELEPRNLGAMLKTTGSAPAAGVQSSSTKSGL